MQVSNLKIANAGAGAVGSVDGGEMKMLGSQKRINTIDRLRGLSVLLMIIANFLKKIEWIPPWMKHAHPTV